MNFFIVSFDAHLKDVKEQVYDVLAWKNHFKAKLQLRDSRFKLSTKFCTYLREKSKVEWAILGIKHVKASKESLSAKIVDANLL